MRLTQITCSYFKKYVDTHIRKSLRKQDFKQPFRGWRVKNNKKYRYTEDRPWTQAAYSAQQEYEYPSILEPIPEWKYFIGDRDDLNKWGKIVTCQEESWTNCGRLFPLSKSSSAETLCFSDCEIQHAQLAQQEDCDL